MQRISPEESRQLHFDPPIIPWYGYVIATFAGLTALGAIAGILYVIIHFIRTHHL